MIDRAFSIVVSSLLAVLFGCEPARQEKGTHRLPSHDLTQSVPDRSGVAKKGPPKLGEDFTFIFAVGGHETGYHVLRINSRGQCTYGFPEVKEPKFWRKRVDFDVTREELESLCEILAENRLAELDLSYSTNFVDGTILFIKCEWGDANKLVYCHNHFPDAVVSIHDYVLDRIIAVHVDENLKAKDPSIDEMNSRASVEDLFLELTKRRKQEESR